MRDKVPRRPENVRPQNAAIVEGPIDVCVSEAFHAQAQPPLGSRIVLGLDGTEPRHHVFRPAQLGSRELLVAEA
jgi:hypothetical protein